MSRKWWKFQLIGFEAKGGIEWVPRWQMAQQPARHANPINAWPHFYLAEWLESARDFLLNE